MMTNLEIREDTSNLSKELKSFEAQFTYPLDAENSFHIDHGTDYSLFYRSMGTGPTRCFVAKRNSAVIGTLSIATKTIKNPEGENFQAAYLGDLKVSPQHRNGRTLLNLLKTASEWRKRSSDPAYAVVMRGTQATPDLYSGRFGIPQLKRLQELQILRIPTPVSESYIPNCQEAPIDEVYRLYDAFAKLNYWPLPGDAIQRSQMTPVGLIDNQNQAWGILEDTRKAKRLFDQNQNEILSTHLSYFGFRSPTSAQRIIEQAKAFTAQLGYKNMFLSLTKNQLETLKAQTNAIENSDLSIADVYGVGFNPALPWYVPSSEI